MKTAQMDRVEVERIFSHLEASVNLVLFTRESDCPHCPETRDTLLELTGITHKVRLEVHNFAINKEKTSEYRVTRVPGIVPVSQKDYGLRYYGMPAKMEFREFLETLVDVSRGQTRITDSHRDRLRALKKPLHVQFFIHGDCVFGLPTMRFLARSAIECESLSVDFIDPLVFSDLVQKYRIKGLPFAVVNEKLSFYAAMSEDEFLGILEKAEQ